jgi:hypothetical protein
MSETLYEGWVWDGTQWVSIGPIIGPQGPQGEQGPAGIAGPRGARGLQGDQGDQGIVASETPPENTSLLWADTSEEGAAVVPVGGTEGQALVKASSDDYETTWRTLTPGDVGAPAITGNNTFTGENLFVGSTTDGVPVIVKGVSGQTANLFEIRNSAETQRFRINNDGYVTVDGNLQSLGVRVGTGVTFTTGQRWVSVQDAASTPSSASNGVILYSENGRLKVRDGEKSFFVGDERTLRSLETSSATEVDVYDRHRAVSVQTLPDGSVRATLFSVNRPLTVSQVSAATENQAASGATLIRMGLYSFDGTTYTLEAQTANDTDLFNSTFAIFTRSFDTGGGYPATFTLQPGVRYAFAVLQVGGTMARLYGNGFTASAINNLSPRLGVVIGSQSDLPSTSTSTSGNNFLMWGRFS